MHPSRCMQNQDEERTVYFLSEISVDEEIALIKKQQKRLHEPPKQKYLGNELLPTARMLLDTKHPIQFEQSIGNMSLSNLENIVAFGLLNSRPFVNLVLTFADRTNITGLKLLNNFHRIVSGRAKKGLANLEFTSSRMYQENKGPLAIYINILHHLHDEFLNFFNFEDDEWSFFHPKKFVKITRGYYVNRSPVLDIFCGEKILKNGNSYELQTFDHIVIDPSCDSIQKGVDSFMNKNSILSIHRYPYSLCVDVSAQVPLIHSIVLNDEKYIAKSFITKPQNNRFVFYTINNSESITYFGHKEPKEINEINGYEGDLRLVFFVKEKISFF